MMNGACSDLSSEKDRKKQLREQIREAERLLDPSYIREAGNAVCRRLLSLPQYKSSSAVFCFASMTREIPTDTFLAQAIADGKRVCVPLCLGNGIMELKQIRSLSDLVPGYRGIPEPGKDAPAVLPQQVSFAVIPCLTCNLNGDRLGRGGGYYDRFLSDFESFAVMICLDRLVTDSIPLEPHDIRIPNVLTERRISLPSIL